MVDSHCHLYKEYYSDIKSVVEDYCQNGISKVINNGCDGNTNREVVNSINEYDSFYGAIGIQPEYVDSMNEEDVDYIIERIFGDFSDKILSFWY